MQNYGLIRESAGSAVLQSISIPTLRDDYILVETVAIALNPTDWTTLDAKGDNGTLVGCDYAGIVKEVGKDVKKPFKKGDRIAGFAHGGNDAYPQSGAFARFIAVKGDLQMHIPDEVTFEAACTVGVGIGTLGYALYKVLHLPLPVNENSSKAEWIFIYGGSTATGTLAIQYAKLSGMKVITTCSPQHFWLMKDRGADLVYDYRLPNIGEQIREATNNKLSLIFDTVSTPSTTSICAAAFSPSGGTYCNLLGVDCPGENVNSIFFLAYSLSGESYIFEGDTYEAQPEDFAFGCSFMHLAEKLWADEKWEPHPQRVGEGGLVGALAGMRAMKEGKVSGVKLVYRIEDTEWP